ncbi:MAG: prenyltransferase [Methanobacterium sp.]|nr:MAG: prenyltransferase [Methanobacterium sp.]
MLPFILKISRFRFWIYTGGTYVVGYALGATLFSDFLRPEYYIYLIYFFLPANIFIYGVNDYWDQDTDLLNPKKDEKEHRLQKKERKKLLLLIYFVTGISLILMFFQNWGERLIFSGFLALSYFYSAPPLRFKEKPFLDFSSNYLYVMPGLFAYYLVSGALPSWLILIGAYCHVSAMHIFSAIPDIEYDLKSGIRTTPVAIGKKAALILTSFFWVMLSGIVIYLAGFNILSFLVLLYPLFPISLLLIPSLKIERLYWYLPYVNTALGGLLFLLLINYHIFNWF